MRIRFFIPLLMFGILHVSLAGENPPPTPQFQSEFFGEMARAFATIVSTDLKEQTMTVTLDKDGSQVTVPIRCDTELHFRDSWGELSDYFPSQHVMLFMYVDDERKWTFPRAIQDDLHVAAIHKWFAKVTEINTADKTYTTLREEKDQQGKVMKEIRNTYSYDPAVKVWKGKTPGAIDSLVIGDEVIQQLVLKDGKKVAVEIVDRAGDKEISAEQDAKHRKDEDALGLPGYVTDYNPLTGALTVTVAWSSAARAKQLKPGDVVAIQPSNGGKLFAAAICEIQAVDTRTRLQVLANSRVLTRLPYGTTLRLFMPGTGPEVPTGRVGVPEFKKK